jgi:glucose/arabinose dehydrogenase
LVPLPITLRLILIYLQLSDELPAIKRLQAVATLVADLSTRKILLGESKTNGFPILHESHGIGSLVFASDGTLLASCGDGASYNVTDAGSSSDTYYSQALSME